MNDLTASGSTGGSSVFAAASQWIEAVLLGSLGTTIAVIAIALIGYQMLAGRLEIRRGLSVLGGCFVLFGAPAIAAALLQLNQSDGNASPIIGPEDYPAIVQPLPQPPVAAPSPFDPYAGAAVPQAR